MAAAANVWDVTGGADKGGIIVRKGCDLNSEAYQKRLVTGAKIREVDLKGQRLNYNLLTGSGPAEGWVSLASKGQPLVQPAANRPTLSLDRLLLRHKSSGTFAENYEFMENLGEGGSGVVFVARNQITGQMRAVKRLPYRKQDELLAIDAECRTLVRLSHPHIMKFYEFYREPNTIYLVTELCTGGTFTEFFRDCAWDMEDARILFRQIISAIQHCHKLQVLHHDLKPENCLMLRDSGRPFAKVIDFGIATIMKKPKRLEFRTIAQGPLLPEAHGVNQHLSAGSDCGRQISVPMDDLHFEHGFSRQVTAPVRLEADEEDQITKLTGSPFWRAPEVLHPDATSGPKADLYSIGLIMFYCLTGIQPLHRGSWSVPMFAKERLEMYDEMPMEELDSAVLNIPAEARELIIGLLEKDKHKRFSAQDALDHTWFDTSVRAEKIYPELPKLALGTGGVSKIISYSCLSDLAGSDMSPIGSPFAGSPTIGSPMTGSPFGSPRSKNAEEPSSSLRTSPKLSPIGSPIAGSPTVGSPMTGTPFGSPRSKNAEEPIYVESPDQDTTPASSAPVAYMCPAFHVLKNFETDKDRLSCSRCGKDFPAGSILHGCRLCDFDACGGCVKSLQLQKTLDNLLATKVANPATKRRVRLGRVQALPQTSSSSSSKSPKSPKSPKDNKFRKKRLRCGSVKSALLLDRILRYKDLEPWHCAVLRLIAHNSHEWDVVKLRERFFQMDTTRSGALSREELKAAMDENGNLVTEDQLEGIFLNLDSQGTGEIEYHEWIAATLAPSITCQETVMKMVFDFFDTNHRGCFGVDELKVLLGADHAQAMLTRAGVTELEMASFMKLMKEAAVD